MDDEPSASDDDDTVEFEIEVVSSSSSVSLASNDQQQDGDGNIEEPVDDGLGEPGESAAGARDEDGACGPKDKEEMGDGSEQRVGAEISADESSLNEQDNTISHEPIECLEFSDTCTQSELIIDDLEPEFENKSSSANVICELSNEQVKPDEREEEAEHETPSPSSDADQKDIPNELASSNEIDETPVDEATANIFLESSVSDEEQSNTSADSDSNREEQLKQTEQQLEYNDLNPDRRSSLALAEGVEVTECASEEERADNAEEQSLGLPISNQPSEVSFNQPPPPSTTQLEMTDCLLGEEAKVENVEQEAASVCANLSQARPAEPIECQLVSTPAGECPIGWRVLDEAAALQIGRVDNQAPLGVAGDAQPLRDVDLDKEMGASSINPIAELTEKSDAADTIPLQKDSAITHEGDEGGEGPDVECRDSSEQLPFDEADTKDDNLLELVVEPHELVDISVGASPATPPMTHDELVSAPSAPQVIIQADELADGHEDDCLSDIEPASLSPLSLDRHDFSDGGKDDGEMQQADMDDHSSIGKQERVEEEEAEEDDDDLEREFDEEPEFERREVIVKRNQNPRDEYELGDELGRGKFGTVFRCIERSGGRQLAAKFIAMRRREDREDVEREVAIMSVLQHKRLLQLYDAFDDGRQEMCLITELVEGGELFERIVDDDFDLTEKKAAIFMRQICEGVEYMHSQQIVHLDMKPENILCMSRTSVRIKLIDFGLARRLDPKNPTRVMFGTPDFAAPEVLGYETVTLATDMWSVGVICYVLLSGLSPFMGESDMDTMANVTRATYDFNDHAFEPISELAKDFIQRLLLRNPSERLKPAECLKHAWLQRGGAQLEAAVRSRRESTAIPLLNNHRLAMEQAAALAAACAGASPSTPEATEMTPPHSAIITQQHRASFGGESTTSSGLISLDKRRLKRYVVKRKWHKTVHAIMALNRMGANLNNKLLASSK